MHHFLFAILVLSLQLNTLLWFRFVWRRRTRWRGFCTRTAMVFHSLLFTFLIVELYFVNFVAISDGFGFTLAAKRWRAKYQKPINSMGFRDIEHPLERLQQKQRLFVVGDSFAAGHGLKDFRSRFANVIGKRLSDDWEVVVLAKGGWSTPDQLNALERYPIAPDHLLLSYYVNDIEQAGIASGKPRPNVWPSPPRILAPVVNRSDFLNFLYWRVYRFSNTSEMGQDYSQYLSDCYNSAEIWSRHRAEIRDLIAFGRKKNIAVHAVVFPNLVDPKGTDEFVDKVVATFDTLEVPRLDVRTIIGDRTASDLTINALDGHPNESLHSEVGNALYDLMRAK